MIYYNKLQFNVRKFKEKYTTANEIWLKETTTTKSIYICN